MKREAEQDIKTLEEEVKNNDIQTIEQTSEQTKTEQVKQLQKIPKTKVAFITGYNGSDFCGSQKNPGVRTVEEEIEKALHRLGHIADFNFGDLKKISWTRATRTDKRVHALQNVFSCKVHLDRNQEEEDFRKNINSELPEDIRIFCALRCSNRFNAKNCTSNREYSYYLPSFMLTKITDIFFGQRRNKNSTKPKEEVKEVKQVPEQEEEKKPSSGIKIMKSENQDDNYNSDIEKYKENENYLTKNIDHVPAQFYERLYTYRLSDDDKEKVCKLFSQFLGTKKYHNFSRDVKASQQAAMRYMLELTANDYMYINRDTYDVTNAEDPKAIEFIHFALKGQSFLYNQIRKMIGAVIQVFRGSLDEEFIENAFTDNFVNVALAPGDGLLLEKVCYDRYNAIDDRKKSEIMLKFVGQNDEIKWFREDIVRHIAKREIKDRVFVKWLCLFDEHSEDFYIPTPQIPNQ